MQLVNVARRAKLGYFTKKGYSEAISKLKLAKEYNKKTSEVLKQDKKFLEFHSANYLIGLLSIMEAYQSDTLFEFLVCYPGHSNEKSLTFDTVAKYGSIAELAKSGAQKKLNELSYKKFSEFNEGLSSILSFKNKIDGNLLDIISEIKATRDIYVHANGVCNEIYIQKSGSLARASIGDKLEINVDYIESVEKNIEKYLSSFYTEIPDHIKSYGRLKAFKEMWNSTELSKVQDFDDMWDSDPDTDMVYPKQAAFDYYWSDSEQAAFDFFLGIFSQNHPERKTDLMYAVSRWPPSSGVGRVIVSWMESPFWF
ncbi:hypothetical protein EIB86_23820 [Vibrio parahaemolyticus]|nr:hypothetical protein [Vibrio parahaemolyticus]